MCLSDECDEGDEYHDEARLASLAGISSMQRSHSEKAKLPSLMNCLGSERGELGQTCIKL